MIKISDLRNIDIISNDGNIMGYEDLSERHSVYIINKIINIVDGENISAVKKNIENYLENSGSGKDMYVTFPNYIIRDIIRKFSQKIIDYLLLLDG